MEIEGGADIGHAIERGKALKSISSQEERILKLREIASQRRSSYPARPSPKATRWMSGPPPPQHKVLHLIRHGEAMHNQAFLEAAASGQAKASLAMLPELFDPSLSAVGHAAASDLATRVSLLCPPPELMVVSPLRRTLETSSILLAAGPTCVAVAHEAARERYGKNIYDRRRSRTEQGASFPQIDFALVISDEDTLWDQHQREDLTSTAERASALLDFLSDQAAEVIAVVSHSVLLSAFLNVAVEVDGQELGSYMAPAELRSIVVSVNDCRRLEG